MKNSHLLPPADEF